MRYELMLPSQIRTAIDENWPVVLPLGVLEYHGEHLPVGLDTLVVIRCVELLEEEIDMVILPAFYYGAGSYFVEPPEGNGTVHVPSEALLPLGKELFTSLLRIGFRNIHGFIHHQTENFIAGMPTDLAFKMAGRQATFDFLEKSRGEGWWGDNKMKDYYQKHDEAENPFNWVQIHPLMDEYIIKNFEFDHAGLGETSLLMSLMPQMVKMDQLSTEKWYLESAAQATAAFGDKGRDLILERMRHILNP